MSEDKEKLINRADSILDAINKICVSMSSKYYTRSQSTLAQMAVGDMKDLIKDMNEYLKKGEDGSCK